MSSKPHIVSKKVSCKEIPHILKLKYEFENEKLPARILLIGEPFISFLVKTMILSKLAMAPNMQIDRHIPPCTSL